MTRFGLQDVQLNCTHLVWGTTGVVSIMKTFALYSIRHSTYIYIYILASTPVTGETTTPSISHRRPLAIYRRAYITDRDGSCGFLRWRQVQVSPCRRRREEHGVAARRATHVRHREQPLRVREDAGSFDLSIFLDQFDAHARV